MDAPFGPYRPDQPDTTACPLAVNVIPTETGFRPMKLWAAAPGAEELPAAPRGGISLVQRSGTYAGFVGTADTIYQLSASWGWTDIGNGYALTAGDDWSFLQFGDYLLLSNTTDGFLAYNVETPAGINAVSGAPAARQLFTAGNAVFALDCDGDNRLMRNSGLNDHTNWTDNGADSQPFEDGGALVTGIDLKNGAALVFQETAINLIQFGGAGGSALYALRQIAHGKGSVGARSVVTFGGMAFYLDTDGFYMTDGNPPIPISASKTSNTFLADVDPTAMSEVQGAADPVNTMVWWRYKSTSEISTTYTSDMIGYNWKTGEWTTSDQQLSYIFSMATPGYTLEELDAFGTMESLPYSLDSRFWSGGQTNFAGLGPSYKFGFFDGDNAAATIDTPVSVNPVSTLINSVVPMTDAAATTQIGVKDALGSAFTLGSATSIAASGRSMTRARGKVVKFRMNIPAGAVWSHAEGFDKIQAAAGGVR